MNDTTPNTTSDALRRIFGTPAISPAGKFKLQVECAWCRKDLGFKWVNKPAEGISHGICATCKADLLKAETTIKEALV